MSIRLRPGLDPAPYAAAYARDDYVQVPDLLTAEAAAAVSAVLESGVNWDLFLSGAEGPEVLGGPELVALGREEITRRIGEVDARARTGFAYRYLGYPMISAYMTGRDPGHLLHTVLEFMNSPEVLNFVRTVTAEPTVIKADAQATYYRPGDYLTLHNDTGVGERRAAYTLGFTRGWRPDWGGQLLFHGPDGEIIRGLQPGFNVLTLFRTPQWHSVAAVASYAGARRLSITGWLRDDPKA
jgi:SM-20-related protein